LNAPGLKAKNFVVSLQVLPLPTGSFKMLSTKLKKSAESSSFSSINS